MSFILYFSRHSIKNIHYEELTVIYCESLWHLQGYECTTFLCCHQTQIKKYDALTLYIPVLLASLLMVDDDS